jgi:AcrR family transcriptional regulator
MFADYYHRVDQGKHRPPIWWRRERGSRGPDPALDRHAIAASAIALADGGGLEAVSMRAVAGRLGTSASALYRYLDDRSDLLDLMADLVVAELRPYPAPTSAWLDPMIVLAAAQFALHERHPWLITLGYRSSSIGPESLAYFDACLGVLAATHAPVRVKFEAIAVVTGLAALFAQQARSDTSGGATMFRLVSLESFPHLATAVAQPAEEPIAGDLFDRTVRGVLTGLLQM